MRLKRREVETSIESTIQTLRSTLEYVRDREGRDDDKILLHRPRQTAETPASGEGADRDSSERRASQSS